MNGGPGLRQFPGPEAFLDRLQVLVTEMLRDEGLRLSSAWREQLRLRAQTEGLEVADALVAPWREPAQPGPQAAS